MRLVVVSVLVGVMALTSAGVAQRGASLSQTAQKILTRVRKHDFERNSGYDGVGDLADMAWRVRTLAVRDLVRLGSDGVSAWKGSFRDADRHVRHVCVMAAGLLGAEETAGELQRLLAEDPDPIVRGQAAEALGQLRHVESESVLRATAKEDRSEHVKHRAELALVQLKQKQRDDKDLVRQWTELDESTFRLVEVGKAAPDFQLRDTEGNEWRLSDFKGKKTVMLVWIFADWCGVCHREFHDLIELEEQFKKENVVVATIECHNLYRSRVMVGERKLWWPHLVDSAGAVAATFGVDPMEFWVHDEWINRPSTIVIDRNGIVRLAYYGTYWGDRPTIEESLRMIQTGSYDFTHPQRRQ